MNLFGFGKVKAATLPADSPEVVALRLQVDGLRAEVERAVDAFRDLKAEWVEQHDRMQRIVRRASMADRNQERAEQGGTPSLPVTPGPPARTLWGARGRIAARTEGSDNGVHS